MAIVASSSFDLTMGQRVMRVAGRIQIDLTVAGLGVIDLTRCGASISLDDQMQTDLPDAARNTAGFGTMGGTCTLAGKVTVGSWRGTVSDLFNPDNPTSPLYHYSAIGCGFTFDFGVHATNVPAPELLRRFTGVVVPGGSQVDHDAGSVTFGLGDLTTTWTTVPVTGVPITLPPYNAGCTNEYVLDFLIRSQEGQSSWPAAPAGAVLSVGLRSSVQPEIGTVMPYGATPPVFAPGAMGSALVLGTTQLIYSYATTTATALFSRCWVSNISGTATGPISGHSFTFRTSQTLVNLSIFIGTDGVQIYSSAMGSQTVSVALGSGPHCIEVGLSANSGSTGYFGTLWVDGVGYSISVSSATTAFGGFVSSYAQGNGGYLEAWQVTPDAADAVPVGGTFTPIAVLDPSLNPLTVPPPIAPGTLAADEMQTAAASEFGYLRRDEQGIIRFSNRQTLAQQPFGNAITSKVSLLKGLTTDLAGADPYNHIQVPYTEWTFATNQNGTLKGSALFTLQSVKKIPTGTTSWTQTLDTAGTNIDLTGSVLANGANPSDGGTYYRASLDQYGNGRHPGMNVSVAVISSTTVQVTVVNRHQTGWLTTDTTYTDLSAGQPGTGLWIGGVAVTPATEQIADVTYNTADKLLTLDSNPYRQDADTAVACGQYLLAQLAVSIRDFEDIGIVPDARSQTADRFPLQDPDRSGINEYVSMWGRSFEASFPGAGQTGGSWSMNISCRAVAGPGGWIGGVPGRSEGGVTTYGYG